MKVKFGGVTVAAERPGKTVAIANVKRGQSVLESVAERIETPGVYVPSRKNVPLFHLEDDNPGQVVRLLNGKTDRGFFYDGEFKIAQ